MFWSAKYRSTLRERKSRQSFTQFSLSPTLMCQQLLQAINNNGETWYTNPNKQTNNNNKVKDNKHQQMNDRNKAETLYRIWCCEFKCWENRSNPSRNWGKKQQTKSNNNKNKAKTWYSCCECRCWGNGSNPSSNWEYRPPMMLHHHHHHHFAPYILRVWRPSSTKVTTFHGLLSFYRAACLVPQMLLTNHMKYAITTTILEEAKNDWNSAKMIINFKETGWNI